jgi:hypothetical protein
MDTNDIAASAGCAKEKPCALTRLDRLRIFSQYRGWDNLCTDRKTRVPEDTEDRDSGDSLEDAVAWLVAAFDQIASIVGA